MNKVIFLRQISLIEGQYNYKLELYENSKARYNENVAKREFCKIKAASSGFKVEHAQR